MASLYIELMNIVLYQPQIPQNCGNIVRTCAVTGCRLTLVRPLGFSISSRWLKRAGLDYWEGVDVSIVDDLDVLLNARKGNAYFLTSKGKRPYTDVTYGKDDLLIFGSETDGLPERYHHEWMEQCVRVPMVEGRRCLNLATTVGIVTYEAWRQQGFGGAHMNAGTTQS